MVGPPGVIDLELDYGVYEAIVEVGTPEMIDLFIANDSRVIPHLLNSAAKQDRVDVIEHIQVTYPNRVRPLDINRMLKYATLRDQRQIIIHLVQAGAKINRVLLQQWLIWIS